MKRIKLLLMAAVMVCFASCSNEEDEQIGQEKSVEVVNLSDYLPANSVGIRKASSSYNGESKVLKFKDAAAYNTTVEMLRDFSAEEKEAYFKKLGFEGAYVTLKKADDELDKIFDIEDDDEFLKEVEKYKEKYDGLFVYNDTDKYDLSPYLPFEDEELKLVGNNKGYVVVGDELYSPEKSNDTHLQLSKKGLDPYEQSNLKRYLVGLGTAVIYEGKYRSDFSVGFHRLTGMFLIRCASQKNKGLWKGRCAASYTADVSMWALQPPYKSYSSHIFVPNEGARVIYHFLLPYYNINEFVRNQSRGVINNFTSSCCHKPGQKEFSF